MMIVTGGAGFIGSNLVKSLTKKESNVVVIDNLFSGSMDNLSDCKILFNSGNAGYEIGRLSKANCVFHLGMFSSTNMYREMPTRLSNVIEEFILIMEYAKKRRVPVIYASSSSVYNGNLVPFSENMNLNATDFYTEGRISIERIAKVYNEFYGVKSIGLRFFSVYGPGEKAKGNFANLVSQFKWSLERNESPVIFGSGQQTRDFIHVDDVVKALEISATKVDEINYGVFNIGTGVETSINDMSEKLKVAFNKKDIKNIYIPNKMKNYVERTKADTTLASNILGFKSSISLDDGIKKLVELDRLKDMVN